MVEELLRRIVKKYAALKRRCEQKKCLLALSVAWALAGEAADGNEAVFEHIDESIHARQSMDGQYLLPSASLMGCYPIMVQGDPFVFDSEGTTMEMIMWDFYAVLIEHAWAPGTIGQFFYDVADEHQWKAYEVESQMLRENLPLPLLLRLIPGSLRGFQMLLYLLPLQPLVQSFQPLILLLRSSVQSLQPLVQSLQPLVQSLQPFVQSLQPLVQSLQPLVLILQPLVQSILPSALNLLWFQIFQKE